MTVSEKSYVAITGEIIVQFVAELKLSFVTASYNTREQDQDSLALEIGRGAVSNEVSIPFLACIASGSAKRECYLVQILEGSDLVRLNLIFK